MKILLSPCLYCVDEETFDLNLLEGLLDFIVNNLDGVLDEYDNAFYSEDRLYMPPICEFNKLNTYAHVINNLRRLKINGEIVNINDINISYKITNEESFNIINANEFQYMINYIHKIGKQNFIFRRI